MIHTSINGIQQAQRWNLRAIAAMKPSGALGRSVQYATIEGHRYVVSITHVDTGALRASHRIWLGGLQGRIYIDPNAINPKGQRPYIYGPKEHARGGAHAFYYRTYNEFGHWINTARLVGMLRGAVT